MNMLLVLCLLFLSFIVHSADACGAGGIGAPTSGAVIALCVVFLPVIIPVVAVGGTGYLAYSGIKKGTNAIKASKMKRTKKRNSDIIKTQMSRAVKLVGRDKFQAHIQYLYELARDGQMRACFDLGVALFLNRDLLGADEYLSVIIDRYPLANFLAHTFFVRGLVNQYLFAFKQAAEDFKEAIKLFEKPFASTAIIDEMKGVDTSSVPRLSVLDAHNSYGFANALLALFGDETDANRTKLLDLAIAEYTIALDGSDVKQGMWYHNRGVARYFKTYYQPDATPDSINDDLELALADFVSAISSGNFGTAADGHAMAAQCCARLERSKEEVDNYVKQAYEADPKVFMVDVESAEELATPWPLPRHEYPFKKSPHQFEKVRFNTPTWCNHCMGFIQNPVGKQGYECKLCKYKVHSKCFPQVKAKSCWSEAREDAHELTDKSGAKAQAHVHRFVAVHFGKPTWCDHCKKFVSNPIGKQGYRCSECKMQIHKDCVKDAKPNFIEDGTDKISDLEAKTLGLSLSPNSASKLTTTTSNNNNNNSEDSDESDESDDSEGSLNSPPSPNKRTSSIYRKPASPNQKSPILNREVPSLNREVPKINTKPAKEGSPPSPRAARPNVESPTKRGGPAARGRGGL